MGLAHERCDEPDMAMMIYQKLIENSPNYISAYLRKSYLLSKMGLYSQALSLYLNALKINPKYTKVYSEIGLCFDKLGNSRDAKRYYRKFLSAEPQDEKAVKVLARIENLRKIEPKNNNQRKVKLAIV